LFTELHRAHPVAGAVIPHPVQPKQPEHPSQSSNPVIMFRHGIPGWQESHGSAGITSQPVQPPNPEHPSQS